MYQSPPYFKTSLKYLLTPLLCYIFIFNQAFSQSENYTPQQISLPSEIAFANNQFSGLNILKNRLFLMTESRLQDDAEGKVYAIKLADLDRKLKDTAYTLPYQKYHLTHLEILRNKIDAAGNKYEGLEAITMIRNQFYFSVETDTPSPNCYLLRGRLASNEILMDTTYLLALPKPVLSNGTHIYNAGFEAIARRNKKIIALFEYNFFDFKNNILLVDPGKNSTATNAIETVPIDKLPFRITDITQTGKEHYTAINFFYKGGGADTIYRLPISDTLNNKLIKDTSNFHNYSRLLDIHYKANTCSWKQIYELPATLWDYNWEGIAAYKKGFFIINDKYTPARPKSELIYLKK